MELKRCTPGFILFVCALCFCFESVIGSKLEKQRKNNDRLGSMVTREDFFCENEVSSCFLSARVRLCRPEDPDCESESEYTFIIFPLLAISIGLVLQSLQKILRLQYTLLLLISGAILGILGCRVDMGLLSVSLRQWVHANPAVFFHWFLAPLIFEASFNASWHLFFKLFPQILYSAFPMVMIQTGIVAVFQLYVIQTPGWNAWAALMFGAMLSATDPIAVTATLKAVGASENLAMLVEGESQLNDGSAFVLWEAFFENVEEDGALSIGDIVVNIFRLSLGGVAMGLAFGLVGVLFLYMIYEMFEVEVSLTIIVAFLGFWTAQSPSKLSGVICNVTSGLVLAHLGKPFISPRVRDPLARFWQLLAYISNTIVFVFSGLLLIAFIWSCAGSPLEWYDYVFILAYYGFLQLLRFALVFLSYPVFKWRQQWFNVSNAIVLSSAGLRGAVSLILASEVGESELIPREIRARVVVWTAGVVALSLFVNGLLIKPILHLLKMDRPEPVRAELLARGKAVMLQRTFEMLDHLATNGSFKGANWKQAVDFLIPTAWVDDVSISAEAYARARARTSSAAAGVVSHSSRPSVALSTVNESQIDMLSSQRISLKDGAHLPHFRDSQFVVRESDTKTNEFGRSPSQNTSFFNALFGRQEAIATDRVLEHVATQKFPDLDQENAASLPNTVGYDGLGRVIEQTVRYASVEVGEELDVEVRRRYLLAMLSFILSQYETSLVEFRALKKLSDDVENAMSENEDQESYALFSFILDPPNKIWSKSAWLSNLKNETTIALLTLILAALEDVLHEPFLHESKIVLGEAEFLFEAAAVMLENLEDLDRTTYAYIHSRQAITRAFVHQEQVLDSMKSIGLIDEGEYNAIREEIVEGQRRYFTLRSLFAWKKSQLVPSEVEALKSSPVFQQLGSADISSYGKVVTLQCGESLETKDLGLIIVLSGALEVKCEHLFGSATCNCAKCDVQVDSSGPSVIEEEKAKEGYETIGITKKPGKGDKDQVRSRIEVNVDREPEGRLLRRSSLVMMTRESTQFHWCFPLHTMLANPLLLSKKDGDRFPPLAACRFAKKSTVVFTFPFGACERLSENSRSFYMEMARSAAHLILLEGIRDESPYALAYAQNRLLISDHHIDTKVGISANCLRLLPYMQPVSLKQNQIVIMSGPAVLTRGKVTLQRKSGEGFGNQDFGEISAPATLPLGELLVEVLKDNEVDIEASAELLVVPVRSVADQAKDSLLRWSNKNSALLSNSRFGAYRHVEVPEQKGQ
mmetsp:Transcript_9481/g.17099  ORF Transcript_9481/g.17099 Transcript_9481/m.17099 type:complete len:1264 (-) Transcript_9481:54-3845(-)